MFFGFAHMSMHTNHRFYSNGAVISVETIFVLWYDRKIDELEFIAFTKG